MKTATIVITTIGDPSLTKAIDAALSQDHCDTKVWVVVNGKEYEHLVLPMLARYDTPRLSHFTIPENIGYDMLFGCRILAASCYLVDTDYILFLNNDDWMDPHHVSSLVSTIEANDWDWGYSLRKIVDKDGQYLFNDDCESLGRWPAFTGEHVFHVDLSCFCIRRAIAPSVAHSLYYPQYHDRTLLACLIQRYPNFGTSGLYTLNYRLGGNPASVTREFFEQGNLIMASRYPKGFPWQSGAQRQPHEIQHTPESSTPFSPAAITGRKHSKISHCEHLVTLLTSNPNAPVVE